MFKGLTTVHDSELAGSHVHVLCVLVGRGLDPNGIDNQINTFVLPLLKDEVDYVVVRVHPKMADEMFGILNGAFGIARFPSSRICVVSRSSDQVTIRWIGVDLNLAMPERLDDQSVVRLARLGEFTMFAAQNGAVLPRNELFHYETSGGTHYRSYFRGGFALATKDHIDGFAFWVSPKIPKHAVILVDNPSLLAAALGTADYLRRELSYTEDEAPVVESRDYYGESATYVATRIAKLAPNTLRRVVVLSSIVSTGNSVRDLSVACTQAGYPSVYQLPIFGTIDHPIELEPPLHVLPFSFDRTSGECRYCIDEQIPVVRIGGDNNLVEVTALCREATVNMPAAKQAREFFDRYSSDEMLVSVHRNQHDNRRHHMIDVDISRLLAESSGLRSVFIDRLHESLVKFQGIRCVVVHPDHEQAAELAKASGQFLDCPVICADPTEIANLPDWQRTELTAAACIVLVDDVCISGSRLRQYRKSLNAARVISEAGFPAVGAVFGLMRPPTEIARRHIVEMIDFSGTVQLASFVEELLLPDWPAQNCPWCEELAAIERATPEVGTLLETRARMLRESEQGLTTELFLPWNSVAFPKTAPLVPEDEPESHQGERELGPRSIFGDLKTEAQVFVAVACAIQNLRSWSEVAVLGETERKGLSESFSSPIARVLSPESYLSGRYYAPVILASILRAARRFDLRATVIEPRVRKRLGERLRDTQTHRAELLYAIGTGKLPTPSEVTDPDLKVGIDESIDLLLGSLVIK